jgi:hypothetical protein
MAHSLIILQGGGPTAVFNISLAAAVEQAQSSRAFRKIYGARFGAARPARGEVCELSGLSVAELPQLRNTPGAALGSSRHKPSESDLHRQLEILSRHCLRGPGNSPATQAHRQYSSRRISRRRYRRALSAPHTGRYAASRHGALRQPRRNFPAPDTNSQFGVARMSAPNTPKNPPGPPIIYNRYVCPPIFQFRLRGTRCLG